MPIYRTHVPNRFVEENTFIGGAPDTRAVPTFSEARDALPVPHWDGHDDAIECYWRTWELALGNLCVPTEGSGFVSRFIDTAFNGCLFMWDSVFILMFARYGARAFDFQQTLDNFYSLQHEDGWICRENREADGVEGFDRHDPAGTGPNIMAWCEWEYFLNTGDRERLAKVFGPLVAYTQWFRRWRSWPDGSYFASGWGCGMDNQPRVPDGYHRMWDHAFMAWIDATHQQILANKTLLAMADVLGRTGDVTDLRDEVASLTELVNATMWHEKMAFYVDRFRDGSLSAVKSIGAYWGLLADAVPDDRVDAFVAHLEDPAEFNRPHRVPTLSADDPDYCPDGGYWRGSIWAPTNYMVLRGLTRIGRDALAHEIGCNHHRNVLAVFKDTGTLWENYAPELVQGNCKPDFVGWTGLPPIAVLLEYVFGLRPNVPAAELVWDVRLTDAHGVEKYPFGADNMLTLNCAARASESDEPQITATAGKPVTLVVHWDDGRATERIEIG